MGEAWRVVDLSVATCQLSLKRGRLAVHTDDDPSREISTDSLAVVLCGDGVRYSSGVVRTLAEHDVILLHCDWRGVPSAICLPTHDHSRVGARHQSQVALTKPRQKNAWAQIVKAKIRGQAANLEGAERQEVLKLVPEVRSGDPQNIEAQAARKYWTRISKDSSFRRLPGSAQGQNSLLDYGYAVVRGFGVRAVLAAGLAPAIGLHHSNRANAFALVDDLIEPFRPVVDWRVFTLGTDASLEQPETKRALVASMEALFAPDSYSTAVELTKLAQRLGKYVEGDADRLEVKAWEPTRGQ